MDRDVKKVTLITCSYNLLALLVVIYLTDKTTTFSRASHFVCSSISEKVHLEINKTSFLVITVLKLKPFLFNILICIRDQINVCR